jgi:predicted aspartyl protease
MKAVFPVMLLAALVPAAASAAKPPARTTWPDTANPLFATPTRRNQVGQIVAPVMIDGKGPFRFLVDTGADGSVVSPALVQALGLAPVQAGNEQVDGTTGTEQLPLVQIQSLEIGNIVKRDIRLPVSDSPVLSGLDGLLGMAGFGAVRVVVDFHHNRVIIDRSRPGLLQGFLEIRAHRTPGGLLMIPARVGDVDVAAVIDTGAEVTLGNNALRQALLREAVRKAKATEIYGVTKQITKGGVAASPTIYLGPAAIRNLAIVYSDIHIFKIWRLEARPALIVGMNVLGTVSTLVLDYPRARVYMLPVESTGVSVETCNMYVGSPLMDNGTDCAPGS